jgi:hypothetical protein
MDELVSTCVWDASRGRETIPHCAVLSGFFIQGATFLSNALSDVAADSPPYQPMPNVAFGFVRKDVRVGLSTASDVCRKLAATRAW